MKKCDERIEETMKSRLEDFRLLLKGEKNDDLGDLANYALAFDYVEPGTFDDQREGYFRYQISWGGPSDEFRFFVNPDLSCHRIEYWFMDWFHGASRTCNGEDERLMLILWDYLCSSGITAQAFRMSSSVH